MIRRGSFAPGGAAREAATETRPREFSAEDVGLASVLVNHLVVAYENAQLLAESRARRTA